jgi:hypothetical protein
MSSENNSNIINVYNSFRQWKEQVAQRKSFREIEKELQQSLSKHSFDALAFTLQDKALLVKLNTIHASIDLHLSAKSVLTALMVEHYPEIVLEAKEDQNVHSLQMQIKARRLNKIVWPSLNSNNENEEKKDSIQSSSSRLQFNSTYKALARDFHESLQLWTAADKLPTLTPFFDIYFSIFSSYEELKEGFNEEELKQSLKHIAKIERDVSRIGGSQAITQMKQYYESRKALNGEESAGDRLSIHLRKQMKEMFYNQLLENLYADDWKRIPALIADLKKMMLEVAPSRATQYAETLDLDFITQKIENHVMSADDIFKMMRFVANEIAQFDSAANDKNNEMWRNTIDEQFKQRLDLQLILVSFFKNAFQRLERIKTLSDIILASQQQPETKQNDQKSN